MDANPDMVRSKGLVDGHAYSLISAHQVSPTLRLIKIRNPWGQKEWNGDWSDTSSKWTPELRQQLSVESKDDGVFFISFEDYVRFFYVSTICKYIDEGDLSVVEDEHKEGDFCVAEFNVGAP